MIFDLDALADIEEAGHRPAFNAAFAELGLDIEWSQARYRQLMALSDERRRVAAELRKRGVSTECDVLAELLVDEVCAAKEMILGETILDADIAAHAGLLDLITEGFGAGIAIGIVSRGARTWVEPLVRQLVGDGVVSAVVTTDDRPPEGLYRAVLAELDLPASEGIAFVGSPANQRMAAAAGLASVLIDSGAAGSDSGDAPLRVADCQRIHDRWLESHRAPSAA